MQIAAMLKPFSGAIWFAIACPCYLTLSAIAAPPLLPADSAARRKADAPLCYIQFQGGSEIDVTNVCGKKTGETSSNAIVASPLNGVASPVFNPKENNASTTGQCNFVDADGNPCTQNRN